MKTSSVIFVLSTLISSSAVAQITYTIDFEKDALGNSLTAVPITVIDDEYAAWGVNFDHKPWFSDTLDHDLVIFDSANPTGGDWDLETIGDSHPTNDNADDWADSMFGNSSGAGNILIIQEDGATVPDDEASGGKIIINFDNYVKFEAIGILDIDEGGQRESKATIKAGGTKVDTVVFEQLGDNSYREYMDFSDTLVNKVVVKFNGSGAITGLKFTDPNVIPEPSTYAMIFGGIALGAVFLRRRFRRAD